MGGNKPFHTYGQTALIEATLKRLQPQTPHIHINAGVPGSDLAHKLARLDLPLIFDVPDYADLGPLSGVFSALTHARAQGHEAVLTTPCDMPHLPDDMISQLLLTLNDPADVVHFAGARDYPLCALWKTTMCDALNRALTLARPKGGLAVMAFLNTLRVRKIKVLNDQAFANINTSDADLLNRRS